MRILFWVGQLGDKFGSIERYNIQFAQKCRQRGHEVIIMHDRPNTQPEYIQGLEASGAKLVVIGDTYGDAKNAIFRLTNLIHIWKPDVVHIHFVNPLVLPVLKILKVPQIYKTWHTSIDSPISLRTRLIRVVSNYTTTRILAVSERVVQDEIRAGTRPGHIQKLYLGVPLCDLLATSSTDCDSPVPLGFNSLDRKVIISVGRFDEQKGMRYVTEAAVNVLNVCPEVIWWFVGRDGPEMSASIEIVKKAGLENKIFFLGQRNDVPSLMQRAYIQVVGSIYEGLGLMAVEAAAFGVPTVGTRIGGLDEAILDGVTGILVPRKSASALAEATIHLLEHAALHDRLGQAAREHAFTNFDSDHLISKLLNLYEFDSGSLI